MFLVKVLLDAELRLSTPCNEETVFCFLHRRLHVSQAGVVQAGAVPDFEDVRGTAPDLSFDFCARGLALVSGDVQQALANRLNLIRALHFSPAS
jgi:hypothetical protein